MLLYARICSRAPHPAESRGIFGRPTSLAPRPSRRPGPATRGHGPSERDLPKDLGLSEVEAEASACLEDVRSLQAEVEELRQQVNSLAHKISDGQAAPLGGRAAAEEGSYYSNSVHSEASSWYSDEEAWQPQQQQAQEQPAGPGWREAREANGADPSDAEDGHWGTQQVPGHAHGVHINGFDTRAGSRAPPDDTGEAAAEGDQYWVGHAEQGSSGSSSDGGGGGGGDGPLESNPLFTDQFLGVLRGSLQRQGEQALTDSTPPPEPRASPNEEVLEHAVAQSKQTLLFMLQWRQQLEQNIAVQQKQVERIDFALSKTRSDAAYTKVLKDMMQES